MFVYPLRRGGILNSDSRGLQEVDMTDQPVSTNPEKDPEEWTTGDEPMTGAQASYLQTLAREAGEEFQDDLTKAEASVRIEELQQATGRGGEGS